MQTEDASFSSLGYRVSLGFLTGFFNFKPNSSTKLWIIVCLLTEIPVSFKLALIFLAEHGEFITFLFIKMSVIKVISWEQPLRIASA